MKGFNFDFLMMDRVTSFDEDFNYDDNAQGTNGKNKSPSSTISKFSRIAHNLTNKRKGAKWRQLIEATRSKVIPFSRSQDSIDSDAVATGSDCAEALTSTPNVDRHPVKLDANVRRQIFAMKMESVSLSQPALQTGTVISSEPVATCSVQPLKTMKTVASASGAAAASSSSSKDIIKPVETKLIESKKVSPCDIIMQKDEWI